MSRDTRLSDVLHVLLHMDHLGQPATSDALAERMGTHPAVFRRTMKGLREAGLVLSGKGPGGGWRLGRPLSAITLLDVHDALGRPTLFAIGNRNRPSDCLVEKSVHAVVADTMAAAEALFVSRFGELTLQQVLTEANAEKRRRAAV